jgi:hypothetical protein
VIAAISSSAFYLLSGGSQEPVPNSNSTCAEEVHPLLCKALELIPSVLPLFIKDSGGRNEQDTNDVEFRNLTPEEADRFFKSYTDW